MATKKALPKLETAIETVARMGFGVGDVLESKFWDVPLQIERIESDEIWVLRLHPMKANLWNPPGCRHAMRYLPIDVAKRTGLPEA